MDMPSSRYNELVHIVGTSNIFQYEQAAVYSYDGIVPKIVVAPASVPEMQEVLRFAHKHKLTVLPTGTGTKLGIGNWTQSPDFLITTTHLNNVIEYEPADLTVTVEAGIRLADLQAELAKHRQFLPLNPPYADRCTIGGIIAANSSGPLRLRYGTARNLVLGLHVLHADGTRVKSGGKVVKNVAGYDLNKLYIGAFGTLGIITEVTLKLSPVPVREAIIGAQFETIQDAVNTGLAVVQSQTLPTFVNLSVRVPIDQFSELKPTLVVGYAGDPDTVLWQLNTAQTFLEQNRAIGVKIIEEEEHNNINLEVQEFPAAEKKDSAVLVQINLKRTDIAEFAAEVIESPHQMVTLLGNGVLYLKMPVCAEPDFEQLANTLTRLRKRAMEVNGNLIIESAPNELKQQIDVWGPTGNTLELMKQIKAKFDARNILNPGRFVSGI